MTIIPEHQANHERTELGALSDFEAVTRLVDVTGLALIDVGCGPADISRLFAAVGATVLGVEPDPVQAEKNRQAEAVPGLSFTEGLAEKLPAESASVDGVFFFRSLHHVPVARMDDALIEAARVLKGDGFLCIVEPAVTGTNFPIMKPFHDETFVRAQAQDALRRMGDKLFVLEERYRYVIYPRHESFDAFVAHVMGRTFNSYGCAQVVTDEVRNLFEAGKTAAGDYRFEQPMLINLYRGVRPVRQRDRSRPDLAVRPNDSL